MSGVRLHFVGVGGAGMCGLAEVLFRDGVEVSGCDLTDSERTRHLRELGVPVDRGHHPDHLERADAIVVSSAVSPREPELVAARERGVAVVRRAEMLAELMRGRRGVAVAGTHGKTTTTALIGHILTAADRDPMVIAGGRVRFMGSHARLGRGPWMVCEADEYDRSFLELGPSLAVITNVEPEHLDCYDGLEGLTSAFAQFANRASVFGAVVLCADDAGSWSLRHRIRRRVIGYGIAEDADLRMEVRAAEAGATVFDIFNNGSCLGAVRLPLHGIFNARNALAAVAVALEAGLEFDQIAEACAGFEGVARRFDVRGERHGVTVVDDYAHHPTELEALFEAARQALPGRRLVAVFQPHLFSRTRDFADDFARALMAADVAVVMPVYAAREQQENGVGAALVVERALKLGHPSVVEGPAIEDIVPKLREIVRHDDVLLTVGAGDVDRVASAWLEAK